MLQFIARNVPPLGYRTYVPVRRACKQGAPSAAEQWDVLENEYFRVRLDPRRGVVASLVDKQSGQELIDTGSKYGFGQYLYERFDADQGHNYLVAFCKSHPWPDWAEQDRQTEPAAGQGSSLQAASPKDFSFHTVRGPIGDDASR